jgi:hypothetical protein
MAARPHASVLTGGLECIEKVGLSLLSTVGARMDRRLAADRPRYKATRLRSRCIWLFHVLLHLGTPAAAGVGPGASKAYENAKNPNQPSSDDDLRFAQSTGGAIALRMQCTLTFAFCRAARSA